MMPSSSGSTLQWPIPAAASFSEGTGSLRSEPIGGYPGAGFRSSAPKYDENMTFPAVRAVCGN